MKLLGELEAGPCTAKTKILAWQSPFMSIPYMRALLGEPMLSQRPITASRPI